MQSTARQAGCARLVDGRHAVVQRPDRSVGRRIRVVRDDRRRIDGRDVDAQRGVVGHGVAGRNDGLPREFRRRLRPLRHVLVLALRVLVRLLGRGVDQGSQRRPAAAGGRRPLSRQHLSQFLGGRLGRDDVVLDVGRGGRLGREEIRMARDERDRLARRVVERLLADGIVQRRQALGRDAVARPLHWHRRKTRRCRPSPLTRREQRARRVVIEEQRHVPATVPGSVRDPLQVAELDRVGGHRQVLHEVRQVLIGNEAQDRMVAARLAQHAGVRTLELRPLLAGDEDHVVHAGVEVRQVEEVRAAFRASFTRRMSFRGLVAGLRSRQEGAGAEHEPRLSRSLQEFAPRDCRPNRPHLPAHALSFSSRVVPR